MKTTNLKTLMVLLLLIAFSIGVSYAEIREVILIKTPYIPIDEDPIEWRMPSRPIQCTISEDGIFIQDYDVSEILFYEIYDFDGNCLLMTYDSQEFISLVIRSFSVEVRLTTFDYILHGFIGGRY